MELPLDGGQVVEDVRVVELEVVQDGRARPVVHELAALVEECGVVLVGLDDEGRIVAAPSLADTPKLSGTPPTRKPGLQACVLEHPGEHGGGGRLAVRSGHSQHMTALQDMVGEPLRPAGVGQPGVEDRPRSSGLPRRDHVAHHEQVGRELRPATASQPSIRSMPSARELVAHRRVDAGIAAGHPMAGFSRQRGDAAHEGAADAEDVNVHRPHSRRRACARQGVATRCFTSDFATPCRPVESSAGVLRLQHLERCRHRVGHVLLGMRGC